MLAWSDFINFSTNLLLKSVLLTTLADIKKYPIVIYCRSGTLGEGGLFSSSEQEGERALRRLRVGRGVSGGEGEGVGGCDFFSEYSESSISSSCSSEPVSSLRESSSSRSSSSPLPCEARQ